jgi:hypothetical protein
MDGRVGLAPLDLAEILQAQLCAFGELRLCVAVMLALLLEEIAKTLRQW